MKIKKLFKYLIISIFSLLSLVLIGLIGVVTLVNPNHFKPLISKAVYQSTGRQLTIAGDIAWKIYPNLGITLNQVSFSNPQGFKESNLLSFNSADVSVALMPLLSQHIIVKTLQIDGLKLALAQQHGINNWTFSSINNESSNTSDNDNKPAKPLQLEMTQFSLLNSQISYDNWDNKQHYNLQPINLAVTTGFNGVISFDQATQQIELNKVKINYNDNFIGEFNGELSNFSQPQYKLALDIQQLKVTNLLQQVAIKAPAHSADLLTNLVLKGQIEGDPQNLKISDFRFDLSNLIKGKFNLDLHNPQTPSYAGNLDLEPFNLNQLLNSLHIAVAERKNKPLLNNVSLKSSGFSGNKTSLAVKDLQIGLGQDFQLTLPNLQINNFTAPTISGSFNLANANLNKLLDGLAIAVAERKNKILLNQVSLASTFKATPTSVHLVNTKFSAGNLISGTSSNLQVNNFANPQISGSINLAEFSLNQLMTQLAMPPIAVANPKILDKFAVQTNFNATKNSLNLTNLAVKLAKTSITGQLNLSSLQPIAVSENLTIDQLDVADFSAINGYKVPIKQLHLNGTAKINSKLDLASLTGQQNISAANIQVLGISLDKLVLQLNDAINKTGHGNNVVAWVIDSAQIVNTVKQMKAQVEAAIKPGNRDYNLVTDLGQLNAKANINNGLINPSQVKLVGRSVAIDGNGSVNLVGNKALNYKVNSQLLVNGINPIFKKLVFASQISGSYTHPSASLDWSSIEQQIMRYILEQNKGQIHNSVKQQINKTIGNQIRQNLGQHTGNQAVDAVNKGVDKVLGKLFGGE
ncbi:MAG: hypothetical protein RLZZ293_166 [Pseudomonadota bacterium]|jgi:uncharacterized protein involved in outer membrane biogenesis